MFNLDFPSTYLVEKYLRHGNSTAREVRVVVLSLSQHYSSRGLHVAGEEGENVVLAALTTRADQR